MIFWSRTTRAVQFLPQQRVLHQAEHLLQPVPQPGDRVLAAIFRNRFESLLPDQLPQDLYLVMAGQSFTHRYNISFQFAGFGLGRRKCAKVAAERIGSLLNTRAEA